MTAPFGESIIEYAPSLSRLREAMSFIRYLIKVSPPPHESKVLTVARPRHLEITWMGKSRVKVRLPHRTYWLKHPHVLASANPTSDYIRYGVTGGGELVVKHPVARDAKDDAVLVQKGVSLTELLDTWQIVSPDDLSPDLRVYIAKGLMRTYRQMTSPII